MHKFTVRGLPPAWGTDCQYLCGAGGPVNIFPSLTSSHPGHGQTLSKWVVVVVTILYYKLNKFPIKKLSYVFFF